MATYRLKRKTFSGEEGEKKGMGLGTKLALGAAAVGGGLLAAKHGAFGAKAQRAVGSGMMKVGMKQSGAATFAKGQAKITNEALAAKGKAKMSDDALKLYEQKLANAKLKQGTTASNYQSVQKTTGMNHDQLKDVVRNTNKSKRVMEQSSQIQNLADGLAPKAPGVGVMAPGGYNPGNGSILYK